MVQISVEDSTKLWQPWLPDEARSYAKCKELPLTPVSGGKWRRERRPRLGMGVPPPDYPHKTDPRIHNEPLDMSTRRPRGSPPSYSQSLSQRQRPSVITATTQPPVGVQEEGGVCDPVIDEHFRRSLGKDYLALFSDSGRQKPAESKPDTANTSEHSASSLSVDDHFAKALGDTWLELQKKETVSGRHRPDPVVTI